MRPRPASQTRSVAEAAALLGVSQRALYEWCRLRDAVTGKPLVPHLRLGRWVLVSRAWVESRLASLDGNACALGAGPRAHSKQDEGGSR